MVDCGDDDVRGRRRGRADRRARATSAITRRGVGRHARHDRLRDRVRHRARVPSPARRRVARGRPAQHRNIDRVMSPSPRLTLRAPSLDDTHAVAAALAGLSRAGDIILLAGEMGAGKTAFAQGFGRALGVTEPITSPTFTLVHSYDTGDGDAAPRRPLPARPAAPRSPTWPSASSPSSTASCSSSGATSSSRRSASTSWCASTSSTATLDARAMTIDAGRRRRRARRVGAALATPPSPAGRAELTRMSGRRMLILGIETATEQVSVAIGGHEGVIALFEVGARSAPRRDPHAGDRVRLRPGRHRARRDRPRRRRRRARAVHRHARRPGRPARRWRWPCGVPMIGISSLDLLAFPHRRSDRVVVPVDRRPQGRGVLRHVPPGARRRAAGRRAAGRPGRRARRRPAGPQPGGAVRRRRRAALPRPRSSTASTARSPTSAHPSAGPLVQLAHARALREEWVSPAEIQPGVPAPARRPDQLVDARRREAARQRSSVRERPRPVPRRAGAGERRSIEPMRRRHVGQVMAIEQASPTRKPWTRPGVPRRAATRRATATATTSSPGAAARSSATAG